MASGRAGVPERARQAAGGGPSRPRREKGVTGGPRPKGSHRGEAKTHCQERAEKSPWGPGKVKSCGLTQEYGAISG